MTNSINYNSNGLRTETHNSGTGIRPVRSTMQVIAFVNGIVGCVLLGVSLILFFISFTLGNYPGAVLGLRLAGSGVAFGGIVELIVSAAFRRAAQREYEKLQLLKSTGITYPAEITRIFRQFTVITGRSQSVYAECTYTNIDGKSCLVRSKSFMYDVGFVPFFPHAFSETPHNTDYMANVYVNPYNPQDYAVEIYKTSNAVHADYDYR